MYLIGAIAVSALFQVIVIIAPFLNEIFKVKQLSLGQWGIVLAASLAIIPIVELFKAVHNWRRKEKA